MKTIFTAGVIMALLGGSALAASDRAGCGYGGEASLPKVSTSAATTSAAATSVGGDRFSVEREGVLTAQSSDKPTTIREDENVRSGGTRTGGSGAPAPGTTGK
jgi:hypothetical protein